MAVIRAFFNGSHGGARADGHRHPGSCSTGHGGIKASSSAHKPTVNINQSGQ